MMYNTKNQAIPLPPATSGQAPLQPHAGSARWRHLLVCLGCCLAVHAAAAQAPLAPSGLLMELHPQPLAMEDLTAPKLSWVVQDPRRAASQSAYQILVATQAQRLQPGQADVWDSGRIENALSTSVAYAGPALKPATRYYWTARTWDEAGTAGPFAAPSVFGTALKDEWIATPIWALPEENCQALQWTDYRLSVDITIHEGTATLYFRASDLRNNYMWQFRSSDKTLAKHVYVNGRPAVETVELPFELELNTTYRVAIEAIGDQIRTYINDQLIDEMQNARFPSGTVGIRHGKREQATYANLKITAPDQSVLLESALTKTKPFPRGKLTEHGTRVGRSENFLLKLFEGEDDDYPRSGDRWALLRTDFTLRDSPIAHATLYATGTSPEPARQYVFRATLNGEFVGVGPTRGYDEMTFYHAYDVSEKLKPGKNALGFVAYSPRSQAVLAQLDIVYADGERQRIGTNTDDWQALSGAELFRDAGNSGSGHFFAPREFLRADLWPHGFDRPNFKTTGWNRPIQREELKGLTGIGTRNLEEEIRKPVQMEKIGPGAYRLDFGRTVVGGLRMTIDGTMGRKIDLRMGEELNSDGSVRFKMRTGNHYQDRWTLADGPQTLQTHGYRVFRHAEVHGLPDGFEIENLTGVGLVYPFDLTAAAFTSSDPRLNEVWEFCRDSIRLLNMELYMDTPSRERRAYEGDAYLQQLAHYALDRDYTLARHSIEYLYHHFTWPTEWKLTSPSNAWRDYLQTGDPRSAARYFERLRDTKTLKSFMDERHLVVKGKGGAHQARAWTDLIDWPVSLRDRYVFSDINTVINSYNYRAIRDLGSLATAIGRDDEACELSSLAGNAAAAINQHLFDPAVNRYRDGLDIDNHALHASIFPLAYGIATGREAVAAEYLIERRIVGNIFSAAYQVEALFALGHPEAALDLLTTDDVKSWRNMIAIGAGASMETWDPRFKGNTTYSHPAAASPAYILPMGLFGIDALEPAHRRFSVEPRPGKLENASIRVPTLSGFIEAAFTQEENKLSFQLTIPANTTAHLRLPASAADAVREGGMPLSEVSGIRVIDANNGFVQLDVSSGVYHFLITK